ncbi:MAG: NUDIX hydrolase [Beijerinckiaceae bacterium]|nr:NUDIX hydrolase [Beijerinckiaceae bacterium]
MTEHVWTRLRTLPVTSARPRLASTLIIVDRSGKLPKVLMGRRSPTDRFMPGKFCFPGGRLDRDDRQMNVAGALAAPVEDRVARMAPRSPNLPRALALTAVRETFEETGLLMGTREHGAPPSAPPAWQAFAAQGVYPDLEPLHFVARATTPPRLPMRYDTAFFAVDREAFCGEVAGAVGPDRELVETVWLTLEEAQSLDHALITSVVLRELERRLAAGMPHWMPAPWYRVASASGWRRDAV